MISVILNDSGLKYEETEAYYQEVDKWAQQNCASYLGYHVQDVSDVSLQWDMLANYEFRDEIDANWFKLRWLK